MQTIILLVHVLAALGMVGLILMQHGKGADAGAAFGSGASATVFGAQGSGSFVTRLTAALATIFFYYQPHVGLSFRSHRRGGHQCGGSCSITAAGGDSSGYGREVI